MKALGVGKECSMGRCERDGMRESSQPPRADVAVESVVEVVVAAVVVVVGPCGG